MIIFETIINCKEYKQRASQKGNKSITKAIDIYRDVMCECLYINTVENAATYQIDVPTRKIGVIT